ncbi:MAG: DNA-directed RNA polymerase subunit omega [Candidatus Omnitrophota bacterium]|nr:MAG: DNA-directed RNA polymerase subunit omega [Candidatus Omnitrophota bacterium]RKY38860.1 MAG: DNA-directed RNA polymerase subunit omega [Candidatus Omnitrophota bacterium]RKY45924.1 MAG: DNA-directed RNA polymerase subunit omega [Candidatus Omnitrophota bacterium]HDN85948.1 DNA-directed RNA polymerase subunit omega [Candidatus Omnitrophota bacterium]
MSQDYVPLEKLLEASNGSVYKLAVLGAKRALQLADGEKPLIEKPSEKALDNALREIALKKIKVGESK